MTGRYVECRSAGLRDGRRAGAGRARGDPGGLQRGGARGQAAPLHARVAPRARRRRARHRRHRLLQDAQRSAGVLARRVSLTITTYDYLEFPPLRNNKKSVVLKNMMYE